MWTQETIQLRTLEQLVRMLSSGSHSGSCKFNYRN